MILEVGRIAPTVHSSQPQRTLVLNTPKEMELLTRCCPFRFHQTLAPAICYEKEISWKRKDYDNADNDEVDTGVIGTHMILQTSEPGVSSTWMMHPDSRAMYREFHIPETLVLVAILMTGCPRGGAEPNELHNDRLELPKTVFYHTSQRQHWDQQSYLPFSGGSALCLW